QGVDGGRGGGVDRVVKRGREVDNAGRSDESGERAMEEPMPVIEPISVIELVRREPMRLLESVSRGRMREEAAGSDVEVARKGRDTGGSTVAGDRATGGSARRCEYEGGQHGESAGDRVETGSHVRPSPAASLRQLRRAVSCSSFSRGPLVHNGMTRSCTTAPGAARRSPAPLTVRAHARRIANESR